MPAKVFPMVVAMAVLLCGQSAAQIRGEAFLGEPLGVGEVTIELPPGATTDPATDDRFLLSESAGRLLYPVCERSEVRKFLRGLLGIETPRKVTYRFLFSGQEPLQLTAYVPQPVTFTLPVRQRPREHEKQLEAWWEHTLGHFEQVQRQAEYPIVADTYLVSLWAKRLGQSVPELRGRIIPDQSSGGTWLGMLLVDESYRADALRRVIMGEEAHGELLPLPSGPTRADGQFDREVAVETLATRVPRECWYARFGSFQNYLWCKDFSARWQGDLGNMLVLRSIRRSANERVQQQLGLSESELSRKLGPAVIADVALLGFDPYLRDGAAIGILFEAKNSFLLGTSLAGQRRAAAAEFPDVVQETVKIAGRDVSFFHTPRGELRSYYATDGMLHLVTTSRRMIERFFETASGTSSLAAAADFRAAREAFPVEGDDTVFVHLSEAFWQQLTSPAMRIGVERRLRATESIHAAQLAALAAAKEGSPAQSIAELVDAGYLPMGFGTLPDGSRIEPNAEGEWLDSVRGYAGRLLPLADLPIDAATKKELAEYTTFRRALAAETGQLTGMSLAVAKSPIGPDGEALRVQLRVDDYQRSRLGEALRMLGPATTCRVATIAGDVVQCELVLSGQPDAASEPIHVFGGLRDVELPLAVRGGGIELLSTIGESVQGYLGVWPKPGLLEGLLGRPSAPLDSDGCARTVGLFELWTRRADNFLLVSFRRPVLMEVGAQLGIVEDPRPAQLRFWLGDVGRSQYAWAANMWGYMRARQTSASACRFMNRLQWQLGVPAEECRQVAEGLVDGTFHCTLGGQYQLQPRGDQGQVWVSTASAPDNQFFLKSVPPGYCLPLFDWFHGAELTVTRHDEELLAEVQLGVFPPRSIGEAVPSEPALPAAVPTPAVPVEELPAPK